MLYAEQMLKSLPPTGYTRLGLKCECDCHKFPNVLHVTQCCYPVRPSDALLSEVPVNSNQKPVEPTDTQVAEACTNYRHDYGLLPEDEKKKLQQEACEWLKAWLKT